MDRVSSASEVLLEAAQPDLYRTNAFRVAELPVSASAREVAKRQQLVEMAVTTGAPVPPGPGRALPLGDVADPAAIREAMHRLREPERRLVDELFWFWPGEEKDAAFDALARGDFPGAFAAWLSAERAADGCNADALTHNLAVLAHLLALDYERQGMEGTLNKRDADLRDHYWEDAFRRWRAVLDGVGVWSRLAERVRELDDPRLTIDAVDRLRATLPTMLLCINAQLAVRAGNDERLDDARRHVCIMNGSAMGVEAVEEATRRALDPVRERIRLLCEAAEPAADADPAAADKVTGRLIAQTAPPLMVLDLMLPAGDPRRDAVHDEVALKGLACVIPFGNQTNQWQESAVLLEHLLSIAAGAGARGRIQDNLTAARNNLEGSLCWFCKTRPSVEGAEAKMPVHRDVARQRTFNGTRTTWRKLDLPVPRCRECQSAHGSAGNFAALGWILGAVAGVAGCTAVVNASSDAAIAGLALAGIGLVVGGVIGNVQGKKKMAERGAQPLPAGTKHPLVQQALADGWHLGAKPKGT